MFATLAVLAALAPAQFSDGTGFWVEVRYRDADRPAAVLGKLQCASHTQLLAGEAKGFVRVDQVFREEAGGFRYGAPGREDHTHIRVDAIYEVRPLAEGLVKRAQSREERDRAAKRDAAPVQRQPAAEVMPEWKADKWVPTPAGVTAKAVEAYESALAAEAAAGRAPDYEALAKKAGVNLIVRRTAATVDRSDGTWAHVRPDVGPFKGVLLVVRVQRIVEGV